MIRTILLCFLICFLPPNSFCADFSLAQINQLPPLPEEYRQLEYEDKIQWLVSAVNATSSDAEKYSYYRTMALEHFLNYANEIASGICDSLPPLPEDFGYRSICIESADLSYEEYVKQFMLLAEDAQKTGNNKRAAQAIENIGWRHSKEGAITQAFLSYEKALSLAEGSDFETLNGITLNTATIYIVNGDREYVQKGIDLLKNAILQAEAILKEPSSDNHQHAKSIWLIGHFNIGIAYALHFFNYQEALTHFAKVNADDNPFTKASLVFSALSAIELNDIELAKSFLNREALITESDPESEAYLPCYRALTTYRWNPETPLNTCFNLPDTVPVEVQIDIYKRLIQFPLTQVELEGLRKFYRLFESKLENQLKTRSARVASHTEMNRLQRESELKTQLLNKEKEFKIIEKEKRETQSKLFFALFVISLLILFFVYSQLNQKKQLAAQFEKMSIQDPLTGLANRRFFEQNIDREMNFIRRSIAQGEHYALGVLLFDVDHFKKINDTHGHDVGDLVLMELTHRVSKEIRDTDLFIRWGGEEFLLIARLKEQGDIRNIAQRIKEAITQKPFAIKEQLELEVSCTIGSVEYPFTRDNTLDLDWRKLIHLSDCALYFGKEKHRNCWVHLMADNITDDNELDDILDYPLEESLHKRKINLQTSFDSNHST